MTYRDLQRIMSHWTDEQLDMDLTIVNLEESEAFKAQLSYVMSDDIDDFGLEDNQPFFYI